MVRKSRAEQDAEALALLEAEQQKIDSGEIAVEEARVESLPEPVPEPLPPVAPVKEEAKSNELEELRHQLTNMKRTLSFYEQELNPAQKRTQQLEREMEELKAELAKRPTAPEGPTDYGLTEEESEFETVKSISEKVSRAQNAKVLKELESLKKTLQTYEDAKNQMSVNAKIAEHRASLTKELNGLNPDELFQNDKILGWAEKQSEEELLALKNPLVYSPKFVAGVLTRFKQEVLRGQAERKPSHGESAVPDRVAPDTIVRANGHQDSEPVFNAATFQRDVQKLISNGNTADAEKLIKVAERAMSA
jgi:hypothetical protein